MNDEQLSDRPLSAHDDELAAASDALSESGPDDEVAEEPERRRSLLGIVLVAVVIILFIIIVILLQQCGGSQSDSGSAGARRIESLEKMQPVAGTVSVWIDDSTPIERVLVRAGVSPRSITDMSRGRYVVEVLDTDVADAVRRIRQQPTVYDAGFVYEPATTP
ncbi:MAG: hypothetical protein CVT67_04435 [Actinobacteria bacterium HGW-Actinobacteria-7]|jgi:hypothetical protein|nr:MAG: hypothetical protein CVT67_04435 [Actinobacteria bacterium HGW-Actinobacteria-7]